MLNRTQEEILRELREADGLDFASLVRIAQLDPSKDLREADLRGVDFRTSELNGFDFTGADLRGARFDRANTTGAIFDNADVEGVIWPPITNNRRASKEELNSALNDIQREVLNKILNALQLQDCRGLVSIPVGLGRSVVIGRLIEALYTKDPQFRRILIVVETGLIRDQYARMLTDLRLATQDLRVMTVASLRNVVRGWAQDQIRAWTSKTDLIISVGEIHHLLSSAREIEKLGTASAHIGITGLPAYRGRSRIMQMAELKERFGGFWFAIDVNGSLKDGLLQEADIEFRPPDLFELKHASETQRVYVLAGDLASQILERFNSAQCIVICRDIDAVQHAAHVLTIRIDDRFPLRVTAVTRRSTPQELWTADEARVLVMTAAMAHAVPDRVVWDADLIAVLTAIDFPLTDRLQFRPARAQKSPATILDYVGSFRQEYGPI